MTQAIIDIAIARFTQSDVLPSENGQRRKRQRVQHMAQVTKAILAHTESCCSRCLTGRDELCSEGCREESARIPSVSQPRTSPGHAATTRERTFGRASLDTY